MWTRLKSILIIVMLVVTAFFGLNFLNEPVIANGVEYGAGEFSYIKNYHFEIDNVTPFGSPDNWTNIDGTNKLWSNTEYISGNHSYELRRISGDVSTKYIDNTGNWCDIAVQPNSTYVLGGWIKVNHSDPPNKTKAQIRVFEYNETDIYQDYQNTVAQEEIWKYYEKVFKTTENTTKIYLKFSQYNSSGKGWFDDITLKNYTTAPALLNGDFENNTKPYFNSPDYWTPVNNITNTWDDTIKYLGNYSYKLTKIDGYVQKANSVYFNITNDSVYKFGGWVKKNNTRPMIRFEEYDEKFNYISTRQLIYNIDDNEWVYQDIAFFTKSNSVYGRICLWVDSNLGEAWFDNVTAISYNLPSPENVTEYPPKPDPSDPWQRATPWVVSSSIVGNNLTYLKDLFETHMGSKRLMICEGDTINLWPSQEYWAPYLCEDYKQKIKALREEGYIIEAVIRYPFPYFTSGVEMVDAYGNTISHLVLIDPKVREHIKNKVSLWSPYASTIIFDEWGHYTMNKIGSFDTYTLNGTPNPTPGTPEVGFYDYFGEDKYNESDINFIKEYIKNSSLTYNNLNDSEKNLTKDWFNFRIETNKFVFLEIKDYMHSINPNMTLGRDYRGENTYITHCMGYNKTVYSLFDLLYSNTIYRQDQTCHPYLGLHTRYHYPNQENRLFLGHRYLEKNLSNPEGCDYLYTSIATSFASWHSVGLLWYAALPSPFYPEGIHEKWAPPFKFGAHNIPLLDVPDFNNAKVKVWGYTDEEGWFIRNINKTYFNDLDPCHTGRRGVQYYLSQFIDYPGTYTNNISNADIVIINPMDYPKSDGPQLPNSSQLNGKKASLYYILASSTFNYLPEIYKSAATNVCRGGKNYCGNIKGDITRNDIHYYGVFFRNEDLDDDTRNIRVFNNTVLNLLSVTNGNNISTNWINNTTLEININGSGNSTITVGKCIESVYYEVVNKNITTGWQETLYNVLSIYNTTHKDYVVQFDILLNGTHKIFVSQKPGTKPFVMVSYNTTTGILLDGLLIRQNYFIEDRSDDWEYLKADSKVLNLTIKRDALTHYDDNYTISYSAQTDINDRLRFMVLDPKNDYYVKYHNITGSAENITANIEWEGIIADKTTHSEEFIGQYTVEIPTQTIVIAEKQKKQNHLDLLNVSNGHVNYAIWLSNFTLEINITGNSESNFTVNATNNTKFEILNINLSTSKSSVQYLWSDDNGTLNFTEQLNGSHLILVMIKSRVYNVNQNKWYMDIQPAINESNSGDKILALNYTFYENITMESNITLEGIGAPIIDGNFSQFVVLFDNVTNSTFSNFVVRDGIVGIELYNSNNNTISYSSMHNNSNNGLYLNYSSYNILTNNNCSDNKNGVIFHQSRNNKFDNNICNKNDINGILLSYISTNNQISNCTIYLNNNYGLYIIEGSDENYIYNNTITNNDVGIYIHHGSCLNNISNCNISENDVYGIHINVSESSEIYNNDISKNYLGIYINQSMDTNIELNLFSNNTNYSIKIHDGNNIIIYKNNFIDNNNENKQAYDDLYNQWDNFFEGNYWDDWTTPDNDSDGIVDVPYPIDGPGGALDNLPKVNPY